MTLTNNELQSLIHSYNSRIEAMRIELDKLLELAKSRGLL